MCEKWTQHPPEHSGACGGKKTPRPFCDHWCLYEDFSNDASHNFTDPNLSYEGRDKTSSEMNFDSQRLATFLHSASQVIFFISVDFLHESFVGLLPVLTPIICCNLKVMVVLLEEDEAERKSLRKLRTQTDTLSFSEGSLLLNTKLPFLYGTQLFSYINYCPNHWILI